MISRHATKALALIGTLSIGMAAGAPIAQQTHMFAAPQLVGAAYREILEPLVRQLEAGRDSGLFPDIDPAADALSIHGAIWASVERQWSTGDCDRRQVRDQVVRFCLRGLGVNDHDGR